MMFSGIQTKVWTLMIQRDLIIPSLIIFDDPKGISIGNEDFDNPKVYGDTSIFDGLVYLLFVQWLLHKMQPKVDWMICK